MNKKLSGLDVLTNMYDCTYDKTTVQYGYDLVGNRRTETVNGILTQSFYNGLNQLTLKQGGSPVYCVEKT
jgi:YD repeat-containing protein